MTARSPAAAGELADRRGRLWRQAEVHAAEEAAEGFIERDIVALPDRNGSPVVEYRYDAWGCPAITSGARRVTSGRDDLLRYRGYVCDEETGRYDLRSRYYDSAWGRFVNSDVVRGDAGAFGTHNLFAYCWIIQQKNKITGA